MILYSSLKSITCVANIGCNKVLIRYLRIYLGSSKTKNGDCKIDVDRRIGMAKSRMIDLGNIWKDKDLSISLKLKILKVLVWTTVMYGAEGWTLKKEEKKKIQSAELWFYRILLNLTWHHRRTNQSILDELRVKRELFGNIVKRKLTFLWTLD